MANLRTIQFLRNANLYESLEAAQNGLINQAKGLADGSPVAGRYTVTVSGVSETRTIFGIVHKVEGQNGTVSFFNNSKEIDNVLDGLDYTGVTTGVGVVVTNVTEANGVVSGTTANVGTLQLTGYEEGSASGHVESTDTINAGIAKLQNQIDAANDKVDALNASTVAEENSIITDVTQSDGLITATASLLSGVKLSGYTEGGDNSGKVASTDTLGEALGKLQGQINGMDLTVVSGDGEVITAVSEADGKVSASKTAVKDVKLTGYVKDDSKTGDLVDTDDIEDALSKIENNIAAAKQATTLAAADKSINVTTGSTGTTVALNIRSGERVLKLDTDATSGGVYTALNVVKITDGLPAEIKERYELRDSGNVKIGDSIDIAKDSHIVEINYISDPTDEHYQNLEYIYLDASGATKTAYVDMANLILETEFASGVTSTDGVAHGVVDPTSESFLTVGANGFKVAGISGFVQSTIEGLDVAVINPGAGKYIYAVEENDGKIAASGANVSDAVLNNYVKGSDADAVAATDTVNQAIGKLENQIDKAKAAATTKVEKDANADHLTLTSSTGSDGSVTYTIGENDVASNTDLTAEITARKAVDGQTGQTYSANSSSAYIGNASNLNDADVKLAAAASELSGKTLTNVTSNGSVTANVDNHTDGTKTVELTTAANQISGLTAVSDVPDEISGVSNTSTVAEGINNLYASLAAEIAARKAAITKASVSSTNAAIVVNNTQSSGTSLTLTLDESKQGKGSEKTGTDNALTITDNGLFLSTIWDAGTFDESVNP